MALWNRKMKNIHLLLWLFIHLFIYYLYSSAVYERDSNFNNFIFFSELFWLQDDGLI